MNKIIKNLINLILTILSYIVEKDKDMYLCGGHKANIFTGNSKYFYLYCNRVTNTNCVWITNNINVYKMLKEKKLPVVKLYSLKGFWTILRASKIFINDDVSAFSYSNILFGNFDIVQLYHANPIKKIGLESKRKQNISLNKVFNWLDAAQYKKWSCIVASSCHMAKVFYKSFNNYNIIVLGDSRNDVLINKLYSFHDYRTKLQLLNYKKVITYVPTFREGNNFVEPFTKEFLYKLNKYLVKNNYVFLIKNHYLKFSIVVNDYSNIIDVTNDVEDVSELLVETDLMITDYSGVLFDYMLLNRPYILYAFDYKEYIKTRQLSYNIKELGDVVYNEDELFKLIKQQNHYNHNKLKNKFNLYNDGKSSERIYNFFKK